MRQKKFTNVGYQSCEIQQWLLQWPGTPPRGGLGWTYHLSFIRDRFWDWCKSGQVLRGEREGVSQAS